MCVFLLLSHFPKSIQCSKLEAQDHRHHVQELRHFFLDIIRNRSNKRRFNSFRIVLSKHYLRTPPQFWQLRNEPTFAREQFFPLHMKWSSSASFSKRKPYSHETTITWCYNCLCVAVVASNFFVTSTSAATLTYHLIVLYLTNFKFCELKF